MSEAKRYTAQEMREVLNTSWHDLDREMVHDMLRQAADAEDELAELRDQVNRDFGESVSLKARLEAVVKECEKQIPACRGEDCKCNPTDSGYCDENCHDEIIVHTAVTAILRVARGDAGKGKTRVNDSSDAS